MKYFKTSLNAYRQLTLIFVACMLITFSSGKLSAQSKDHFMRVAKIKVDAAQVENYKAALKEGIETAVKVEPGVLTLYAVSDKNDATSITVFEIYQSEEAYKLHIETPHFKKYKETVKDMVRSLELTDVKPVAMSSKLK
jgi:quinol monooxygenase YgiN